jgi:hypothetical protein
LYTLLKARIAKLEQANQAASKRKKRKRQRSYLERKTLRLRLREKVRR